LVVVSVLVRYGVLLAGVGHLFIDARLFQYSTEELSSEWKGSPFLENSTDSAPPKKPAPQYSQYGETSPFTLGHRVGRDPQKGHGNISSSVI